MNEWADPDYEPTIDEIRDTFGFFRDVSPGAHGTIVLIPTMERYIWVTEGIWWSRRRVREDEMIEFAWLATPDPECLTHD